MTRKQPLTRLLMKVVPLAFLTGAGIELFMIYVRVGSETFYETAKRLEQTRQEDKKRREEELIHRVHERRRKNVIETPDTTTTKS